MSFITVKNNTEKLNAIKSYCESRIQNIDYNINFMKSNQDSPADYKEEIDELQLKKCEFEKILEIINATEKSSILIL